MRLAAPLRACPPEPHDRGPDPAILQRAIKQIVANFPVYRTYVDLAGSPSDADRRDIAWAVARARRFDPDVHPSPLSISCRMCCLRERRALATEISKTVRAAFCDEAAAVLRTGHGEGRRGYRLLSLQSLPGSERSRRRARPLWRHAPLPCGQRPAGGALAARDAGDGHARHQARRGRQGEARGALGAS